MLTGHRVVGTSMSFTRDECDLWDGGLSVGVQELGTVLDDASILLVSSGQEARHVYEGDNRNVEGIAETDETSGFD